MLLVLAISMFNQHFYPMTYKDDIIQISNQYSIEPSLLSSIANVESGMKSDAISSKGAKGIMQLMPSTAKWLAEKLGVEYNEDNLFDVSYSFNLGAFYLSYLQSLFRDEKTAICAYNAGQGKVKEWLQNEEYSKDGKTLYNIPFEETKNYLNKAMKNLRYYEKRYK